MPWHGPSVPARCSRTSMRRWPAARPLAAGAFHPRDRAAHDGVDARGHAAASAPGIGARPRNRRLARCRRQRVGRLPWRRWMPRTTTCSRPSARSLRPNSTRGSATHATARSGSGVSRYVTLRGLVQHRAHRAGQIALSEERLTRDFSPALTREQVSRSARLSVSPVKRRSAHQAARANSRAMHALGQRLDLGPDWHPFVGRKPGSVTRSARRSYRETPRAQATRYGIAVS